MPPPGGPTSSPTSGGTSAASISAAGGQGHPGAWVWVGVGDVRALHRIYRERGAKIRMEPKNFPWALEMQIEDPDGNVLRFGSEPEEDG